MCNNPKAGMAESCYLKMQPEMVKGARLLTVCASAHEGSNPSPSV